MASFSSRVEWRTESNALLKSSILATMRMGWFQKTTYRKACISSPVITLPMTPRDPKRSKSWPWNLWSSISRKPCERDGSFKLTNLQGMSWLQWFQKTIYRKARIASPVLRVPTWAIYSPRGTPPKFAWNRSGVAVLSRKPAISLKRDRI